MRVAESIEVSAPAQAVWQVVGDPSTYLHVLQGVTRWERCGELERGAGARFRMLMRVRSAEIGGLIELVEWDEPRELAWASVTGIDQRGRWRLRQRGPDRTHVELRLSYGVAGSGLSGLIAEHLAAPTVAGHLRASVRQLKRRVEHEQLRAAAAARRKARARA